MSRPTDIQKVDVNQILAAVMACEHGLCHGTVSMEKSFETLYDEINKVCQGEVLFD